MLTIVPAVLAMERGPRSIRVGCKNFSEQRVLGELIAQRIESRLKVPVKREFGFGSTQLLHGAFARGEIDVYVEYTGTAEQSILKISPAAATPGDNPDAVFAAAQENIRKLYAERFDALWLKPLGFNNSYTVVCRKDSEGAQFKTLSELGPQSHKFGVAMNSEFVGRADGYPALKQRYGLDFRNESSVDIGFIYPALDNKQVEFAVGFYTDARLSGSKYAVVEDNLHVFPRYDACPVLRKETAARVPELEPLLLGMAGTLDAPTMREMNKSVEQDGKTPHEVDASFWAKQP
jgi:glycine betaine/choline ABC-type transport system substrate-binding protein